MVVLLRGVNVGGRGKLAMADLREAAGECVLFGIDPGAASVGLKDLERYAPEEVEAVGRDLHLHLPNGMGRSKLAVDLGRRKGARGTARSLRTVTRLLDMAQALG